MNNKGYTLKELLILLGLVSFISLVAIIKTSYAFSEIDNKEEIEKIDKKLIDKAASLYGKSIKDQVKEEKTVIITGEDLMKSNFLARDDEYNVVKVKYTYNEEKDSVKYEVEK